MAINKTELVSAFQDKLNQQIRDLEKKIDEALRDRYTGSIVSVSLSYWPHQRVHDEIKRLFREAGWQVVFRRDKREGVYIDLS